MKVYRYYFQGQTKFTWATCMLKLPNVAQQNCLFPNKEITFLAGYELHIQTLAFLIILTLKQYITAKTSEVRNINCHDHYWQPLTTYAASIPAHSWSISREMDCFLTESALIHSFQSALYPQSALHLQSAVCVLHWLHWVSYIPHLTDAGLRCCQSTILFLCFFFEVTPSLWQAVENSLKGVLQKCIGP